MVTAMEMAVSGNILNLLTVIVLEKSQMTVTQ